MKIERNFTVRSQAKRALMALIEWLNGAQLVNNEQWPKFEKCKPSFLRKENGRLKVWWPIEDYHDALKEVLDWIDECRKIVDELMTDQLTSEEEFRLSRLEGFDVDNI